MDFDPNAPEQKPKTQPEWATYVPGYSSKRPNFKTHTKRQHALAAADWRGRSIIYKWNFTTHEWDEAFRIDGFPQTKRGDSCFYCGIDKDATRWPEWVKYEWQRDPRTKQVVEPLDLVVTCYDCRRRNTK